MGFQNDAGKLLNEPLTNSASRNLPGMNLMSGASDLKKEAETLFNLYKDTPQILSNLGEEYASNPFFRDLINGEIDKQTKKHIEDITKLTDAYKNIQSPESLKIIKDNLELLQQLNTNVYTFGAAKTFQQTKEITSLLVDEDGNVRTSREFNKIARETYDNWNNNWGVTEYNTAIAQADMANKWNVIQNQKDVMPMLRYSAIGDACSICKPLDGITAKVEDPIWNTIYPTNHFNCLCVVLQEDGFTPSTNGNEEIVNDFTFVLKN